MDSNKQQNQIISSQSLMYIGPLPPPKEFNDYEQTLPGTANRILAMAEQESEHRRKNEEKIVQHSIQKSGRGQIFAFILAILSLGLVLFSILKGEPLGTIVPAIIALSSLIAVFAGKKQN
jgi:uncharacterized membrane protein